MQNIAGHEANVFLFRFVLKASAIDYVESEAIAEDMYPDIATQILPLARKCAMTLSRYRHLCETETIFDAYILSDGELEVMLSPGLGIEIPIAEKQELFDNGHDISMLLIGVMDRRYKEVTGAN